MIDTEMTVEDARIGMRALEPKIKNYARLIVRKGVNVQPGQQVAIDCPVECAPFAHELAAQAYEAGAKHVTVMYSDESITRLSYENEPVENFEIVPEWRRIQLESLAEEGACFIIVEGADPAALKGIDPAKPAAARRARNTQCKKFRHGLDYSINPWCIAGAPVVAWARQVFPGVADEVAMYKLWNAILQTSRSLGDDPQAAWDLHNAAFEKNLRFMNDHKFVSLRYTAKNGTNLEVGMTDAQVWAGGKTISSSGLGFFPNIPTEEVFCSPDCHNVNGTVYSALPLVHNGCVVDNFWLTFKDGSVVDYGAEKGEDVLKSILDTDEGAKRLGEVALISKNTPIRESGILFYDTLYDENASCHLALGASFAECYEGGFDMDEDQLYEHGLNKSATHVDFMIGADDINIIGVCADGSEVDVFVNGQWVWE